MKKSLNKKGQFYLLAAVIIVALILSFAVVTNYIQDKPDVKIYDLQEELGIEGGEVIEYGVYNGEVVGELMEDFTSLYSEYAGENKNLYYVFGNPNKGIFVSSYQDLVSGSISVDIGTLSSLDIEKKKYVSQKYTGKDKIKIKIKDIDYDFDLNEGENFYFVISQDILDERFVVVG